MFNKAGKTITIFIVLIIVLLLCSTSIGFYLYHLEERLHKKVENELGLSHAENAKLQAQIKDIQAQLALAQDKNKEANQKINDLLDQQDLDQGIRAALKKENAQLKDQITGLDAAKQKMKSDLDDAASKLAQYQDLLKSSEDKSKQLEARLASLAETNKTMQAKLDGLASGQSPSESAAPSAATAPPAGQTGKMELNKIVVSVPNGPGGHILSVDTDAEFVVFNLGLKEGVKPDDLLSVYRGNQYMGDIKATRVQDDMSAADIIPPLRAQDIHKNDSVVLKP